MWREDTHAEKEAFAVVWDVEHFHLYLYGKEYTLVTDHINLEKIENLLI